MNFSLSANMSGFCSDSHILAGPCIILPFIAVVKKPSFLMELNGYNVVDIECIDVLYCTEKFHHALWLVSVGLIIMVNRLPHHTLYNLP